MIYPNTVVTMAAAGTALGLLMGPVLFREGGFLKELDYFLTGAVGLGIGLIAGGILSSKKYENPFLYYGGPAALALVIPIFSFRMD
jgi:hypothetical protein